MMMHPTKTQFILFLFKTGIMSWYYTHYFVNDFFCYTALRVRDNFDTNIFWIYFLPSLYFGNYYNTFLRLTNNPPFMNHSTTKQPYHVSAQISWHNLGRFPLRDLVRISLCSERRLAIYLTQWMQCFFVYCLSVFTAVIFMSHNPYVIVRILL
jgi:hypothetical protein